MDIEIKIPDIGSEEVEITEVLVRVGESVSIEQPLLTVEGNKTSMEIPSSCEGIVKSVLVSVGDMVKSASLIMIFKQDSVNLSYLDQKVDLELSSNYNDHIHATPAIRRMARELDMNLEDIIGSGRKGRVLREDIEAHVKKLQIQDRSPLVVPTNSGTIPRSDIKELSSFGEMEEVELTRIQTVSSSNLAKSWTTIPHVTLFGKYDITDLETFRIHQNNKNSHTQAKITAVVLVSKAVAYALERMQYFNSSLSSDSKRFIVKKYINIGIAVDTDHGLFVPVIKSPNKKGLLELAKELKYLSDQARSGKLKKDEMEGGTFTISSLGKLGTTAFTPIINPPEVAVLGISKSSIELVWDGEKPSPRLMLPLSLSFDHRVINGAYGARFIDIIGNVLEDFRHLVM
jgi:pyruvate dehydrogenase E2 component (dihydrolipoamide acetyltransferase)